MGNLGKEAEKEPVEREVDGRKDPCLLMPGWAGGRRGQKGRKVSVSDTTQTPCQLDWEGPHWLGAMEVRGNCGKGSSRGQGVSGR